MKNQTDADPELKENRDLNDFEYPIASYKLDLISLPLGYIHWHWHEEVELLYVAKGQVECHISEEILTLHSETAVFINQNVLHSLHPINEENNCVYSIVFRPSYLFGHGQTYLGSKYLVPILSSEHLKYCCVEQSTDLFTCIQQLIQVNQKKEYGYELLTKAYLCNIWYALLKQLPYIKPDINIESAVSLDDTRVKNAIRYIELHYAEAITLDDIASSIHISRSECCRCFKRAIHLTPFEYLMKHRIFESTRILQANYASDIAISELASKVGFNNTSYFNKLFKKYIHCTPSEYRQQLLSSLPSQ